MSKKNLNDRFWEKVNREGPTPQHVPQLGPCWIWTAGVFAGHGYGAFWDGSKLKGAHVVSWFFEHGSYPDPGHYVCHHCDNPGCIRPSHLFLGDALINMRDKVKKGRAIGAHRGSAHHLSKLITDQILQIRQRYDNRRVTRVTQRQLALEYGVHQVTISEIVTRKIWAHL